MRFWQIWIPAVCWYTDAAGQSGTLPAGAGLRHYPCYRHQYVAAFAAGSQPGAARSQKRQPAEGGRCRSLPAGGRHVGAAPYRFGGGSRYLLAVRRPPVEASGTGSRRTDCSGRAGLFPEWTPRACRSRISTCTSSSSRPCRRPSYNNPESPPSGLFRILSMLFRRLLRHLRGANCLARWQTTRLRTYLLTAM